MGGVGLMSDKLGPYELNTIVTGDARELAESIPDCSVDLIFCDPIYSDIEAYRWVGQISTRVLKPDKSCLVWGTNKGQIDQALALRESGLIFNGALNLVMWGVGGTPTGRGGKFIIKHTPCFWLSKGDSWPCNRVWSISTTTTLTHLPTFHKWSKDPGTVIRWLNGFSQPGDIILDPFTGGGTVPAVCKMLGRNYLAFEIDPVTAESARERVLMTQPPLLIPQPIQLDLLETEA